MSERNTGQKSSLSTFKDDPRVPDLGRAPPDLTRPTDHAQVHKASTEQQTSPHPSEPSPSRLPSSPAFAGRIAAGEGGVDERAIRPCQSSHTTSPITLSPHLDFFSLLLLAPPTPPRLAVTTNRNSPIQTYSSSFAPSPSAAHSSLRRRRTSLLPPGGGCGR
jgi:hypothetical protein